MIIKIKHVSQNDINLKMLTEYQKLTCMSKLTCQCYLSCLVLFIP